MVDNRVGHAFSDRRLLAAFAVQKLEICGWFPRREERKKHFQHGVGVFQSKLEAFEVVLSSIFAHAIKT